MKTYYFKTLNKSQLIIAAILTVLVYCAVFLHLDRETLYMWDESRLAVNAAEMTKSGNFLVTTFNNKPDLWNTKPPLMVILQSLFMRLIGINELAVRLPSALAITLVCYLVIWFSKKVTNDYYAGIIALLSLITSQAYNGFHIGRTGDYDAILSLFTFCYVIFAWLSIDSQSTASQNKFLRLTFFFILISFWTKTIQGLIFVPIVLTYLISNKQVKIKVVLIYSFFIAILGLAYYFIREFFNPGYIDASFFNDVSGRFFEKVVTPKKWSFYFSVLAKQEYAYFIYSIPFSIFVLIVNRGSKIGKLLLYFWINTLFYMLFLILSQSKGIQYLAPLYPLLCIILGLSMITFFRNILQLEKIAYPRLMFFLLAFTIYIYPFYSVLTRNISYQANKGGWEVKYGGFLKYIDKHYDYTDIRVLHAGYNAHLDFYILSYEDNPKIEFKRVTIDQLELGDYVLFCGSGYFKDLNKLYEHRLIENYQGNYLIQLTKQRF